MSCPHCDHLGDRTGVLSIQCVHLACSRVMSLPCPILADQTAVCCLVLTISHLAWSNSLAWRWLRWLHPRGNERHTPIFTTKSPNQSVNWELGGRGGGVGLKIEGEELFNRIVHGFCFVPNSDVWDIWIHILNWEFLFQASVLPLRPSSLKHGRNFMFHLLKNWPSPLPTYPLYMAVYM